MPDGGLLSLQRIAHSKSEKTYRSSFIGEWPRFWNANFRLPTNAFPVAEARYAVLPFRVTRSTRPSFSSVSRYSFALLSFKRRRNPSSYGVNGPSFRASSDLNHDSESRPLPCGVRQSSRELSCHLERGRRSSSGAVPQNDENLAAFAVLLEKKGEVSAIG